MKKAVVSCLCAAGIFLGAIILIHVLVVAGLVFYHLLNPESSAETSVSPILVAFLAVLVLLPFLAAGGTFWLGMKGRFSGIEKFCISLAWGIAACLFLFLFLHIAVVGSFVVYNLLNGDVSADSSPLSPIVVLLGIAAFCSPFFLGTGTFYLGMLGKLPGTRA